MSRISLVPALLAALVAFSGSAPAQACGTTLHGSISLSADMVCPPGTDGLVVGADHVRIELNGYRITSPNSVGTVGIRSSGFHGVKVVGPGAIAGFFNSLVIEGGDNHEIREVDVAAVSMVSPGHGVILRNTSGTVVAKSRVGDLHLSSHAGQRADGNRIGGNRARSVDLYGCMTTRNEIADNDIRFPRTFAAVSLVGGAKGNVVMHNRIESGSVWIGGASENLVEGNTLVNPPYASYIHAGVIMGHHPSPCSALALVPAEENVVRYNGIEGAYIGVALTDGALRNKILDNKIYGAVAIGMHFSAGSADNDGRSNWYSGVPRDVTDLGRGNLWP